MEDLKKSVLIKGDNIIGFTGRGVIPMTQEEFNALPPEKQLNGSYYITDGTDEIVISDNEISDGKLWSSQKISNELATKLDKEYITGITDANNAIGENGINIFVMSASSANMPLSRTGIIRSYTTIENKYIRVNQEYSTIDNSPQNGGTYKRYGASDDGGETFTWSNWNFVGSIDDSTTAALKTWSSSKIASEINPTIDISKVFSNGTLNIATLCTTYGAGRYVAVGQGTTGNGTVTIDIWTLVGGAISYMVNALYSPKTSIMFVGYTYENPTIDFDANYFIHCNHIAKVCTLA